MNSNSPNAYARYEQGISIPWLEKLNELMKAIDSSFEPILKAGERQFRSFWSVLAALAWQTGGCSIHGWMILDRLSSLNQRVRGIISTLL